MSVIVDTVVWSLALRRRGTADLAEVIELRTLIEEARVQLIGPIRQELLSGIRDQEQYKALREHLRPFPDLPLITANYERAAEMFNLCRRQGIQGSNTDFLICAVAEMYELSIFTIDQDFQFYQKVIPIVLHELRQ